MTTPWKSIDSTQIRDAPSVRSVTFVRPGALIRSFQVPSPPGSSKAFSRTSPSISACFMRISPAGSWPPSGDEFSSMLGTSVKLPGRAGSPVSIEAPATPKEPTLPSANGRAALPDRTTTTIASSSVNATPPTASSRLRLIIVYG